jgi:hypothetical protein
MTDTPARRPGPLRTLSSLEWKLALTAVLSAIYAFGFVAVARPPASQVPASTGVQSAAASTSANTPPVQVSSARAAPSTVASASIPRTTHPRIRTRSS